MSVTIDGSLRKQELANNLCLPLGNSNNTLYTLAVTQAHYTQDCNNTH